ncbi:unnamed protein product [Ambrosiozyma monospora]|uniref:Unnamed protein product n=1 Tax=Ambrosiozyma monospora TaxID=43982 RepID=A0A9W6Z891_AMBMO|nr:unnamed protein product [Ambrosiozyma monospora]
MLGIGIKLNGKNGNLKSIDLNQSKYIDKLKAKMIGESAKVREYKTPMDPGFYFCPHDNKTMINGKELSFKIKQYRETIGALMYLSMTTRPDISYASNYLSRFQLYPHSYLDKQLKRIINYLVATKEYKITYSRKRKDPQFDELIGYSDADLGGDKCTGRSTIANVFMYMNGPIYWKTRCSFLAALSSTESELIGMVTAGNEMIYLIIVMNALRMVPKDGSYTIYADNTSAITLADTAPCKGRTKHFSMMIAKAHDQQESQNINFEYVKSEEQLADILTKPVLTTVMQHLVGKILNV